MKLTGAQILWETLLREGVEVVFGYPGGANLPIYDAMLNYPIHHVLTRHEQGAAHMADAYARASGRVGVAMATSGPGATNLVTGIATAMMDSSPTVFITGQVTSKFIGLDAFQETDVTGITLPITKHNYLVRQGQDLGQIMREAFFLARTGRPGPVLVDSTLFQRDGWWWCDPAATNKSIRRRILREIIAQYFRRPSSRGLRPVGEVNERAASASPPGERRPCGAIDHWPDDEAAR